MSESENNPEVFWDKRASTFPRYSGLEDSYEVGMLNLARQNGIVFKGRRLIDIGCGSGLYTIGLALEAAEVTAVDISSEMLAALRSEADRRGLKNIRYVHSNWLGFAGGEKYDVVFCSMSPAVRDEAGRIKMLEHAAGDVVYIGWGAPMKSDVAEGLYLKYGLNPPAMVDAPELRAWLDQKDLPYRHIPVSGRWKVKFTFDDIFGNCLNTLNNHGTAPDKNWLAGYLGQYETSEGLYLETTDYEVEMILFTSNEKK